MGSDQAVAAGPFLWLTRAGSTLALRGGDAARCSLGGQPRRLSPAARPGHAPPPGRAGRPARPVSIADWIECAIHASGRHCASTSGPDVDAELDSGVACSIGWPRRQREAAHIGCRSALRLDVCIGARPIRRLAGTRGASATRHRPASLVGRGTLGARAMLSGLAHRNSLDFRSSCREASDLR